MKANAPKKNGKQPFEAQSFLEAAGVTRKTVEFVRKATIFAQGAPAKTVMYILQGGVKISVVNGVGKEAVVAMLGPGDFFGEGALAGQLVRIGMATAVTPTSVLMVDRDEMMKLLHGNHE